MLVRSRLGLDDSVHLILSVEEPAFSLVQRE